MIRNISEFLFFSILSSFFLFLKILLKRKEIKKYKIKLLLFLKMYNKAAVIILTLPVVTIFHNKYNLYSLEFCVMNFLH